MLGSLAQSVEQLAFNQLVTGSNPVRPTKSRSIAQLGSAPALGAGGRWFESSYSDQLSHSSSGLGHRPFTAGTGVRTSYGTPIIFKKCENITKKGLTFLLDLL